MTPAQLEHLKRIDAHLARLLDIAEKRTPGEWLQDEEEGLVCFFSHDSELGFDVEPIASVSLLPNLDDPDHTYVAAQREVISNAAFIASCAGNAESGWRATRAAIDEILSAHRARYESWCLVCQELNQDPGKLEDYPLPPWSEDILAAFPLESLK